MWEPVMMSFNVFFAVSLDKLLSKLWSCLWFDASIWYYVTGPLNVAGPDFVHHCACTYHDDVIKWKHFPRYWPFVRWIHRSPVNSPDKGQWRGALMFSLICAWRNGWVNATVETPRRQLWRHCNVVAPKRCNAMRRNGEDYTVINIFFKVSVVIKDFEYVRHSKWLTAEVFRNFKMSSHSLSFIEMALSQIALNLLKLRYNDMIFVTAFPYNIYASRFKSRCFQANVRRVFISFITILDIKTRINLTMERCI